MSGRLLPALALLLAATAVSATPMDESPRPPVRPTAAAAPVAAALPKLRPLSRPEPVAGPEVTRAAGAGFMLVLADPATHPRPRVTPATAVPVLARSPRPVARPAAAAPSVPRHALALSAGPEVLVQAAFRAPQATGAVTGRKGTVCGDPAILGKPIPPILGKAKGCGLEDGVSVTAIAGVALSQPASIDCATARSLKDWVEGGVKPAVGRKGGGVAALQVAGSYSCRPRNNQKGNRISEHGRGRAVDISAIVLADGTALTVAKGWGTKSAGKTLASMRKSACGPFNTVLGPGSDPFHHDHFHLDTAHGRGPYCR